TCSWPGAAAAVGGGAVGGGEAGGAVAAAGVGPGGAVGGRWGVAVGAGCGVTWGVAPSVTGGAGDTTTPPPEAVSTGAVAGATGVTGALDGGTVGSALVRVVPGTAAVPPPPAR